MTLGFPVFCIMVTDTPERQAMSLVFRSAKSKVPCRYNHPPCACYLTLKYTEPHFAACALNPARLSRTPEVPSMCHSAPPREPTKPASRAWLPATKRGAWRSVHVRTCTSCDVALCCVVLRCVVLDVALCCVVLRCIGACTSCDVALCCVELRCVVLGVALCCIVLRYSSSCFFFVYLPFCVCFPSCFVYLPTVHSAP